MNQSRPRPVGTSRTTVPTKRRRSEAGDTLVEVLLAVMVLGLASVAMIIAFSTSISASAEHRQLSATGIVLDSVSQEVISEIQAQPVLFTCPQPGNGPEPLSYYQANVPMAIALPYTSQYSATFASSNPVQFWNPSTSSFSTTCEANEPQLITISVTELSNGRVFSNSFVVDSPLDGITGGTGSAVYGTAAQLVFTTEPVGGVTGEQLATQPVVTVEDASNNVVVDDLSPVILTITGSSGVALTGCAGTETLGVVTFKGCTVGTAGTYTLTATDGNMPGSFVSTTFTVSASADYLVFKTQPVGGASGATLQTQPVVEAYTAGSLDASWSGTVTLTSSGGVLSNCSSAAAVHGVATFAGCSFSGAYFYNPVSNVYLATPYTLTASASVSVPTSPATSQTFAVTGPGSASQLVFTTQPTGVANANPATPFVVQPVVTVEDSFGNIVTTSSVSVKLSISSGTLSCRTNPVNTSGGAASFSGCGGSVTGTNLTLQATASGLASTTSASFNITGPVTQIVFTTQPFAGVSGAYFTTQPVVTLEDATGTTVTSSTAAITLTSSGGALSLCSNLTPNGGVVQVATCSFAGIVGTSYNLTAQYGSGTGALTAVSGYFTPSGAGAATQLVFTTQPVAGAAGSTFTTQPVVSIEDSGGNVTTSSSTITLSSSGGVLSSCSNLTAIEGVVQVADCTFGGLVSPATYTLTASSGSLAPATSSPFTPTAPGPVSGTASTVSASPTVVLSTGSATSTVTVTLFDSYGNPVSAKNVVLTQGGTSSVITPISSTTNASGVATFSVSDTLNEVVTYSATDSTDSVPITQQAQVSFVIQLMPSTGVTLGYGTVAGSISVNFAASSNAPAGQTYTATACTNSAMTTSCVGPVAITSGGQITGLGATQGSAGTNYYVTVTAVASTGFLASTSIEVGPQAATSQVNAPTGVTVASSTTTAGAITATFTAPSGTTPSSFTAAACTDSGMSANCTTQAGYVSGAQITGLSPGTNYYVTITANPPVGYLAATTAVSGPASATIALTNPTVVTLGYGTTKGSISVNFSAPSNAPGGQTYTAKACTNSAMLSGCVGPIAIASGGQITGLSATQGNAGTSYYVTVTAVASTGYLASTSIDVGPQAATSQVSAPTGLTTASSTTTAGAITAAFTTSTGIAPSSYTAKICANSLMTTSCTTFSNYTSASQITGLTAGNNYYVTITANPPTGYVAATTAAVGPTPATIQLNTPTGVTLGYGTVGGSISVTFTAPSNAPGSQAYTALACTDSGMTLNCVGPVAITSGGQITALVSGTPYYVTVTAVASAGYLSSAASSVSGPQNAR